MARWLVCAAALLALLTGCGTGGGSDGGQSTPDTGSSERADVPSALADRHQAAFPEPLIDLDHLVSGGPPPDGIPPIDEPTFQPADRVAWLADDEPVLSLTVGEETRAYPLQVMTWHEIVNDVVDGVPVAVTYCPLCNSGVAFERQVGDRLLDFGTSGLLYVDNLVMYDRQTESLWPQLTGEAAVGHLTGSRLTPIPMGVVGWGQFRTAHPDALVLTRDTGHDRPYGQNPYAGYDDPEGNLLVEPPGGRDPRLPVKTRVVGVRIGGDAVAVSRDRVASEGVVELRVDDRDIVIWHRPGQVSALDESQIAESDEIGTIGVFSPDVDGRALTFRTVPGGFVDAETGSAWNVMGQAEDGPLAGSRLELITHLDTFWFAWVGFWPDTRLSS